MESRYLFGASASAARRPELLARLFRESTRDFLRMAVSRTEFAQRSRAAMSEPFRLTTLTRLRCSR